MEESIKCILLGEPKRFSELAEKCNIKFKEILPEELNAASLRDSRLLFAIHLGVFGIGPKVEQLVEKISQLYEKDKQLFFGSVGAIYISSEEEEYTKLIASLLVYRLNKMGLRFVGRPIVEAPGQLDNFATYTKRNGLSRLQNLEQQFDRLLQRLCSWQSREGDKKPCQRLLVLHSSNEDSNTLELWQMVKEHLKGFLIEEISLGNGKIFDCKDCGYTICKHFAKQKSCYYGGGIMVEEVYPAIIEADLMLLLCPNYNDALTANLSAMINRLTALFRHQKFYEKKALCNYRLGKFRHRGCCNTVDSCA